MGPFLGTERRKSLAGLVLEKLGNFKIITEKKIQILEHILGFSAPLCDQNSLRYRKKLLVVFFVASRYYIIYSVKESENTCYVT